VLFMFGRFNFFSANLLARYVSLDLLVRLIFVASAVCAWARLRFLVDLRWQRARQICVNIVFLEPSSMGFGPDTLLPSLLYSTRNFCVS
jgi:hypothetical protein